MRNIEKTKLQKARTEIRKRFAATNIKRCSQCKLTKSHECFQKDSGKYDGLNQHCRQCVSSRRQNDPELREKLRQVSHKHYEENKSTPETKEKRRSYNSEYYKRPEVRVRQAKTQKEKYQNEPIRRLDNQIRSQINYSKGIANLGRKDGGTAATYSNVPNLNWVFVHLERVSPELFDAWWDGSEDIHLDHIYPRREINNPVLWEYLEENGIEPTLENRTNYIFSHTNLRLMRAKDNISKLNSLEDWEEVTGYV